MIKENKNKTKTTTHILIYLYKITMKIIKIIKINKAIKGSKTVFQSNTSIILIITNHFINNSKSIKNC